MICSQCLCVRARILRITDTIHCHTQPFDRRIKSAIVDFHVISLLRRLTLYTSVHIVEHFKRQSYKYYNEFITSKSNGAACHTHLIYNLNKFTKTCAPTQQFVGRKIDKIASTQNHIYNMKDLVNGNAIVESGNGVHVDQKSTYHSNGVGNGDR